MILETAGVEVLVGAVSIDVSEEVVEAAEVWSAGPLVVIRGRLIVVRTFFSGTVETVASGVSGGLQLVERWSAQPAEVPVEECIHHTLHSTFLFVPFELQQCLLFLGLLF